MNIQQKQKQDALPSDDSIMGPSVIPPMMFTSSHQQEESDDQMQNFLLTSDDRAILQQLRRITAYKDYLGRL